MPLLGIYLDETLIQKDTHPDVHSSTIHNGQNMETTHMSIARWMAKDVVHIYNRIFTQP